MNGSEVADELRSIADKIESESDDDGLPEGWVDGGPTAYSPHREIELSDKVSVWVDKDGDFWVTVDGERDSHAKSLSDLEEIIDAMQDAPELRERNTR